MSCHAKVYLEGPGSLAEELQPLPKNSMRFQFLEGETQLSI